MVGVSKKFNNLIAYYGSKIIINNQLLIQGKWPTEYGVGVQEERLRNDKCSVCTQKSCFRVKF